MLKVKRKKRHSPASLRTTKSAAASRSSVQHREHSRPRAQDSQIKGATMKRVIAKLLFMAIVSTIPNVARAQRPAAPETLIRNATVITVTHGTLQNTDVLLRNGKIAAVGK